MALPIRLTSGRTSKTFDIITFDSYSIDLDMPITSFRIPETDSSKAELIKIEGNFKSVTISWLMLDNGVDVSGDASGIITTEQQRDYLENQFETFSIADGDDKIDVIGSSPSNNKTGKFVKILITKDASEPNNYRATVTLYQGVTIITAEDT